MRLWSFQRWTIGRIMGSQNMARYAQNELADPGGTPAEIPCSFCMVPKGYGCINVLGELYGTLLTYSDGRIDFHLTRKKEWEYEKFRASLDADSAAALIDEGDPSLSRDT